MPPPLSPPAEPKPSCPLPLLPVWSPPVPPWVHRSLASADSPVSPPPPPAPGQRALTAPPPPPPATRTRFGSSTPSMRTSDAPPPPCPQKLTSVLLTPASPPPLKPPARSSHERLLCQSAPLPPTKMLMVWPGVTVSVATARPPNPPGFGTPKTPAAEPPCAPTMLKVAWVTPAGTTHVWAPPVNSNVLTVPAWPELGVLTTASAATTAALGSAPIHRLTVDRPRI